MPVRSSQTCWLITVRENSQQKYTNMEIAFGLLSVLCKWPVLIAPSSGPFIQLLGVFSAASASWQAD